MWRTWADSRQQWLLAQGPGEEGGIAWSQQSHGHPPPREGRPGESTAGRPGDPFIREEPAMCW